jgi:UrcA family protein
MKRLNTLLVLALALSVPAACLAVPPGDEDPRSRAIQVSDLDLSRPAEAAQLYRRIERAAIYVCEPFASDSLARTMLYRKCVSGAVARAVADVNSPLFTQYVAHTNGRILSRTQARLNR